jgi:hypothetical protein
MGFTHRHDSFLGCRIVPGRQLALPQLEVTAEGEKMGRMVVMQGM